MDATPHPVVLQQAQPTRRRRLLRLADRLGQSFVWMVLLPLLGAVIYFGPIASPVYISESRYVVRSAESSTPSGLGSLLQGTGLTHSQDDTYLTNDYILSRDALRQLDASVGFRKLFTSGAIDVFDRFPSPGWRDDSFEAMYRYYGKHVDVDYDTVSSITSLEVRAYTAEAAQRINERLLELAEQLVNDLNARSSEDLLALARQEVKTAEDRAKDAALALAAYRSGLAVFDPDRQSALQLEGIAKIQADLLEAQAQLSQVRGVSPNNPQIPALQQRVDLLRAAIASEGSKVTGKGPGSLSTKSPAFDRLVLEESFAGKQLALALASLDSARHEALRKRLYLDRIVQPNLADKALEPRRMRSVAIVLALSLIVWGLFRLLLAGVREHTD